METEFTIGDRRLRLLLGDITEVHADAIVNAANAHLAGGGGVDGAIHRAGGPEIMEECRQIGGCPTGSAVATGAGRLPAKAVIHAVAPRWRGGAAGEARLLSDAYRRCLQLADEMKLASIAFPSLGTGAYGYPVAEAAGIAVRTVADHLASGTSLRLAIFVLFSSRDLSVYAEEVGRLGTSAA